MLKFGDQVLLKSFDGTMTVTKVFFGYVQCSWEDTSNGAMRKRRAMFHSSALDLVDQSDEALPLLYYDNGIDDAD